MDLAFGYIRRSSYKQQENNSIEIQKAHIKEFANRKKLTVPDEFIYIEDVTSAYSKRADQRKELMRLKATMIESEIPRVIFFEESRMDRTGYTFVKDFYRPLQKELPQLEVYTTNSEEPFNPDNPQTKTALLVFRQESEIKSERALASLTATLENKERIRPGAKVPYGYKQVDGKLIPNEQAEIVSFIYYLQSWGTSMGKIAIILNEAAIPSPNGGVWGASTIETILKNSVYTGTLTWNIKKHRKKRKFEHSGSHEPLIDHFLIHLNKNNLKLQNQFGRLDTPFLFLKKIICSGCNEHLKTQNASTNRNGKKYCYQYYVCKTCAYKLDIHTAHATLLPSILTHVQSLASSEANKTYTVTFLKDMKRITKETIANLEKNIDKLKSKGCIAKEHEDEEFQAVIHSILKDKKSDLESLENSLKALAEIQEAVHSGVFFTRFSQVLEQQLNESEKRLIILYFVELVLVLPDKAPQIVFRKNPFESIDAINNGQSTENDR
ncbi:recombinase family protein [Halobacillus rhizosphaerae]|uniref:recombinase family protein n=1 Tax=Halobacillus rhizosphaerae TaxID=3064889 RepID=UPI00398A8B1C